MTRTKRTKKLKPGRKPVTDPVPKIQKQQKLKRKRKAKTPKPDSDSDSDPQSTIQTLLEPFSKDQLITLVTDLSLSHSSLLTLVQSEADKDVSHRKVFVHGLGWDATRDLVQSIFAVFGEMEDLHVVVDRATGKCKGYAFVTFKSRKSAEKLLRSPKVTVGSRVASCQLATMGGVVAQQHFPVSSSSFAVDYPQRKIYVRNVPVDASLEKLRVFFQKFGEIESGPTGLDPTTRKFKGYALFVYKTVEGAKKVLEEPYKVFEGTQLHCSKAAEGKGKVAGGAASITTALQPVQPQMLAAVAAAQQAQNMALLGQQTGLVNPYYGGMFANANLGALMGSYYGMMGAQYQGLGLGAYSAGSGVGAVAGAGTGTGAGGSSGAMIQGLQYMYPSMPSGQNSSLSKDSRTSATGYPSSLWYGTSYICFTFYVCTILVLYQWCMLIDTLLNFPTLNSFWVSVILYVINDMFFGAIELFFPVIVIHLILVWNALAYWPLKTSSVFVIVSTSNIMK